jgi:hypothetical protein
MVSDEIVVQYTFEEARLCPKYSTQIIECPKSKIFNRIGNVKLLLDEEAVVKHNSPFEAC